MNLSIDHEGDTLHFTLSAKPVAYTKELEPFVLADFADDGTLVCLAVVGVSRYNGGKRLGDLDLDLTPHREYLEIEVDPAIMAKLLARFAQPNSTPAPSLGT